MSNIRFKFDFSFKQMISSFLLWLTGITLNMLPILYKVINDWLCSSSEKSIDFYETLFWSDLDFLAINFSVSFLLLLELCFIKSSNRFINKSLQAILFFVTLVLIIIYTIATFSSGWSNHVSELFMKYINFGTLISVVCLGTIYFLVSSLKITREVINNA